MTAALGMNLSYHWKQMIDAPPRSSVSWNCNPMEDQPEIHCTQFQESSLRIKIKFVN